MGEFFARLYDRPVPSAPEAEMALLGSLILDPACLPEVAAILPPGGGFYDEKHAAIYRGLCRCYQADSRADMVDLVGQLRGRGEFDTIGHAYLTTLANSTPSAAGAARYARAVADAARRRRIIEAAGAAAHEAFQDPDAEGVAARALQAMTAAAADCGRAADVPIQDATAAVMAALEAGEGTRVPTGLAGFDQAFEGIPEVGVTTILGVPGSGKSSLAAQIVIGSGLPFRVFSFEMTAERITENLLSSLSHVCTGDVRKDPGSAGGLRWSNLEQARATLDRLDLRFVEDSLTAPQIRDRCSMHASLGARGFVIDYVQNVPPSNPRHDERERVAEVMRTAQQISRQHKATVIVVSQPTQEAGRQNRPPLPSDGRGAQEIWAASDMMLGVYRPAVFEPRHDGDTEASWAQRREAAQVHVLKNKHGRVGYVNARFIPELTRFE